MPTPEQKAREQIDRLLTQAGWLVRDYAQMHIIAGPGAQDRADTWSEETPEGRWRSYGHEDLAKRDRLKLDIFWLKNKSLEDAEDPLEPEVLAQEIIEDLQADLEQFSAVAAKLGEE